MIPVAQVGLGDSWESEGKAHNWNKAAVEALLFFSVLKCDAIIYKSTKLFLVQWTTSIGHRVRLISHTVCQMPLESFYSWLDSEKDKSGRSEL